jgi:hypothetical protein
MRFTRTLAAGAVLLMPWALTAQEAPQAAEAAAADAAAEATDAAAETMTFKHDKACMDEVTPELEAFFGEAVAWPDEGQAVFTPAGLTILGHPVSYVLVKHGGPDGVIDEIGYRLEGMQRKVGQPHEAKLLKDFDAEFHAADCSDSKQSVCGVIYDGKDTVFTGAEVGSGEIYVGRDARGPSLALVEADYDMADADPVFLVCFYRGKR